MLGQYKFKTMQGSQPDCTMCRVNHTNCTARSFTSPQLPGSLLPSARMPMLSLAGTYHIQIIACSLLAVASSSLTPRAIRQLYCSCLPLARHCSRLMVSATCLQQPLVTVTVAGDTPHLSLEQVKAGGRELGRERESGGEGGERDERGR